MSFLTSFRTRHFHSDLNQTIDLPRRMNLDQIIDQEISVDLGLDQSLDLKTPKFFISETEKYRISRYLFKTTTATEYLPVEYTLSVFRTLVKLMAQIINFHV